MAAKLPSLASARQPTPWRWSEVKTSSTRRCAFAGAVALALIAGTAAAAKGSAAKKIFVLWDQWLQLPEN